MVELLEWLADHFWAIVLIFIFFGGAIRGGIGWFLESIAEAVYKSKHGERRKKKKKELVNLDRDTWDKYTVEFPDTKPKKEKTKKYTFTTKYVIDWLKDVWSKFMKWMKK